MGSTSPTATSRRKSLFLPLCFGTWFANHLHSPSCHVTNKSGKEIQKNFYKELMQKLDAIHPGISTNVS